MSRVTLVLKTNEGGMWAVPQMREFVERGNDVTAVIPSGDGKLRRALDADMIPVVESPFDFSFHPSLHLLTGLFRLRRTLRATRPDVLFYHLYASALACRFASLGMNVRKVHMVAGPLYLESPKIAMVERALCRLDDHLIAGSEYTASRYRAIGMPDDRLSAIPYGVDISRFKRGTDNRLSLFNASEDTFVVVMVAYVYAPKSAVFPGVGIKGHETLLNAWAEFCVDHPDSVLVLAGSGFDTEGERHRQQLLQKYNVANNPNILWLDTVEDVRPLYSSADISVSPSLSENHGAVLEASAMGLPSIVSDAGALPETVSQKSGWVVPAGKSAGLVTALGEASRKFADRELAAMGAAARKITEAQFEVTACVSRVADVIEIPQS
jgi:glycosyltransferase involved in cell wall biosynthesis